MAHPVDLFILYQFIKRLAKPFNEWRAFELGLIDANGHILIHPEDRTVQQKNCLSLFDTLILNLKKLIAKVPGGATRIGTFAAALLLLKESENELTQEDLFNIIDTLEDDYFALYESVEHLTEDEGGGAPVASGVPTNNTTNIAHKDGPILTTVKRASIKKRNTAKTGEVGGVQ